MPNNFEIHIGFPTNENSSTRKFLEHLKSDKKGWVYSDVFNVDSNPEILDPHNVPGTLGCLVSKDYSTNDSRVNEKVREDMQFVLSLLSLIGIENARVELEFVFGYSRQIKDRNLALKLPTWNMPSITSSMLEFDNAEKIEDTPNSEIHFVLAPDKTNSNSFSKKLTMKEASEIIKSVGVDVKQTIEYRSQAMRAIDTKERKLICTSYYENPEDAKEHAEKLLNNDSLIEQVSKHGYTLKFVIERIFACYKPIKVNR